MTRGDHAEDGAAFVAAFAAAATGDTEAQGIVGPALDEMAADPDWTALATVLRRILDGDPTPHPTDDLTPAHAAVLDAVRAQLSP